MCKHEHNFVAEHCGSFDLWALSCKPWTSPPGLGFKPQSMKTPTSVGPSTSKTSRKSLWSTTIVDDTSPAWPTYQKPRNSGSIVCWRSCRISIINSMKYFGVWWPVVWATWLSRQYIYIWLRSAQGNPKGCPKTTWHRSTVVIWVRYIPTLSARICYDYGVYLLGLQRFLIPSEASTICYSQFTFRTG